MTALRWRVEQLARVDSTQDEMRRRLLAGVDVHALVLRAREQTGGRGRRERSWSSPPGGSYQTLALRDATPPRWRSSVVPLWLALGVAEALAEGVPAAAELRLKWPNDLVLLGTSATAETAPSAGAPLAKVGGVLCEYLRGHLLVGVGLNVANPLPAGAAALRGAAVEVVSELVLGGVERALAAVLAGEALPPRFACRDALAGRKVVVAGPAGQVEGCAAGVSADGRLRLRLPAGNVLEVAEGSVRLAPPDDGGRRGGCA